MSDVEVFIGYIFSFNIIMHVVYYAHLVRSMTAHTSHTHTLTKSTELSHTELNVLELDYGNGSKSVSIYVTNTMKQMYDACIFKPEDG